MVTKLISLPLVLAAALAAQSDMPWTEVSCRSTPIYAKLHIKHAPNLSATDPQSRLMASISLCDRATAVALIASGMDLNFVTEDGDTPVSTAVFFGENTILRPLLDHGADPNGAPGRGIPVMSAALTGNIEGVRLLLDHGAKPDKRDHNRATALMNAADFGYLEIVKLLLARGADPRLRDVLGETAADCALLSKHPEIAELLKAAEEKMGPDRPSH